MNCIVFLLKGSSWLFLHLESFDCSAKEVEKQIQILQHIDGIYLVSTSWTNYHQLLTLYISRSCFAMALYPFGNLLTLYISRSCFAMALNPFGNLQLLVIQLNFTQAHTDGHQQMICTSHQMMMPIYLKSDKLFYIGTTLSKWYNTGSLPRDRR